MSISRTLILLSLIFCIAAAPSSAPQTGAPTSRPSTIDDGTWQRMLAIDAKAAKIEDLTAEFEQQKITAMLKKPLVSAGRIYVRGSAMLWDTRKPEPTILQITAKEVRLYYPQQKTIEVYQIEQKLGQIAASPLPRLATLLEHFSFDPLAISELGATDSARYLAVKMTPLEAELREHVEQIRVLLDTTTGLIEKLEMHDPDGDRTLITFSNAKPNTGLRDAQLQISAPANVKMTRPLQAIEGQPAEDSRR